MKRLKHIVLSLLFLELLLGSCSENINSTEQTMTEKLQKEAKHTADSIRIADLKMLSEEHKVVKAKGPFTHQDTVELHAIGDYYFGKMSDNDVSPIWLDGVKLKVETREEKLILLGANFDEKNQGTGESNFNTLLTLFSQKYGKPKSPKPVVEFKSGLEQSNTVYSARYSWQTKYKNIELAVSKDKVTNQIKHIAILVSNKELLKEEQEENSEIRTKQIKKELEKI